MFLFTLCMYSLYILVTSSYLEAAQSCYHPLRFGVGQNHHLVSESSFAQGRQAFGHFSDFKPCLLECQPSVVVLLGDFLHWPPVECARGDLDDSPGAQAVLGTELVAGVVQQVNDCLHRQVAEEGLSD